MNPGLLLLILRILMGVFLFGFLVFVLITLRRDLRQQAPQHVMIPPARLILHRDGTEPLEFPLELINLIGRAADNTIMLEDEVVSAHHARLSYVSGRQWWLEDLGSRNGTLVNGLPVEQPLVVTDGDRITFGTVECELAVEGVAHAEKLTHAETGIAAG
ncbi:MAG: FHA domain-containing protein [Anaerolineales bacterium]|nr:FHA domain-containing protein [Anaerolineales bacterium]